jgi:hypothetical protein
MSIFDENEITDLNAILNWKLDNGLGSIDEYMDRQVASDFNFMGRAFLCNSIMTLYDILKHKNLNNEADVLIFPILFNVWHSIELLLKSGNLALDIVSNPSSIGTNSPLRGHDILLGSNSLYVQFKSKISNLSLHNCETKYLKSIENLINDFSSKNARFDFGRYSYDLNLNPQFYNQPDATKRITNNTYINLTELFILLLSLVDDFVELVDELNNQILDIKANLSFSKLDYEIDNNIVYKKKISSELDRILSDDMDFYEFIRNELL